MIKADQTIAGIPGVVNAVRETPTAIAAGVSRKKNLGRNASKTYFFFVLGALIKSRRGGMRKPPFRHRRSRPSRHIEFPRDAIRILERDVILSERLVHLGSGILDAGVGECGCHALQLFLVSAGECNVVDA